MAKSKSTNKPKSGAMSKSAEPKVKKSQEGEAKPVPKTSPPTIAKSGKNKKPKRNNKVSKPVTPPKTPKTQVAESSVSLEAEPELSAELEDQEVQEQPQKRPEIEVDSDSADDSELEIDETMSIEEIERKLNTSSTLTGKKALLERASAALDSDEEDDDMEDDGNDDGAENGEMEVDDDNDVDEENAPSAEKWRNRAKQRVLLISSRGINHQHRHLFNDLNALLPHLKKDAKIDSKNNLQILNELCELSNCNNCIFFEVRRKQDLYMWMSKAPNGPSIKFHVLNIHTMDELKLTGNALKGSRPLLSFDKNFDSEPHLMLMKEVLKHLFNTPRGHRKSKPFIDHIISFTVADNKIWFRNYQVSPSPGATPSKATNQPITLTEIGPRFVLTPIKVFDGSFGGRTMWSNDDYVTPTKIRLMEKQAKSVKYKERMKQQVETQVKKKENALEEDPIDSVFKT